MEVSEVGGGKTVEDNLFSMCQVMAGESDQ